MGDETRRFENGRWWQWDGQQWLLEPEAPGPVAAPASPSATAVDEWDGDESDPEYQAALKAARETQRQQDSRRGWIALGVVAAVIVGGMIWSASSSSSKKSPVAAAPAAPTTKAVTYYVRGTTTSANVTVETPSGTSQQETDVPMFNKGGTQGLKFTFQPGAFVYISAQNGQDSGTIECAIEVDGVEISRNSASGGFAIAQCNGTA